MKARPFTVGFAAETEKLREHAQGKLERKQLDMIVANDVSDTRIGFNSENNAALILSTSRERDVPLCSKDQLADIVIAEIAAAITPDTET